MAVSQKRVLDQGRDRFFCERLLKYGSNRPDIRRARIKAISAAAMDSVKNCMISLSRTEPNVFRIATSLARFSLRAVERFMKLIQASNKTNTPIIPNSQI